MLTDWWAEVQEEILRSEYHITWQEQAHLTDLAGAYHAPNRAHSLRTYFTPRGIRVIPRVGATPAWEWGLALAGVGYGDTVVPAGAAELAIDGGRIEYRRTGLIEWY
jgi:hypothetical protein